MAVKTDNLQYGKYRGNSLELITF